MAGGEGGGSRLEAKKNLPTLGTNFNSRTPLVLMDLDQHVTGCLEGTALVFWESGRANLP